MERLITTYPTILLENCSGALLMNAGIDMTELEAWDYQSAKLYFHTVDEERYYETF